MKGKCPVRGGGICLTPTQTYCGARMQGKAVPRASGEPNLLWQMNITKVVVSMFGLQAQFNFQLFQSYYDKGCLHKHIVARVILGRQEWRRLPSTAKSGNSNGMSSQPVITTTQAGYSTISQLQNFLKLLFSSS